MWSINSLSLQITSPILEILYFKINKKNLFSDIFIPWKRISFNVDNVIFIWYSFVLCWVEEKQTFSLFRQQNILLKYWRSYLAFRTESLWFHFVLFPRILFSLQELLYAIKFLPWDIFDLFWSWFVSEEAFF